ncbi:hypothetical protein GALL_289580 [mine drainage metagenome]|uniref:Uncharacterized protein n=1 Tax=mine drainage metagenome TaxID=410659 RepID=A0A1J5QZJ6_9ZZZZ
MRMGRATGGGTITLAVLLLAVAGQLAFQYAHRHLREAYVVLPAPPSALSLSASAFGDRQALFRLLGFEVQNFGDTGGHFTPLRDYDYGRLVQWLKLLDGLDSRSDYTLALAGLLFGQAPEPHRDAIIAAYMRDRAMQDPVKNWRWLAYAVFIARHRAKDIPLALSIAGDLTGLRSAAVPVWARQLQAFTLASAGDDEAARDLMGAILASEVGASPEERQFMKSFIQTHGRPAAGTGR